MKTACLLGCLLALGATTRVFAQVPTPVYTPPANPASAPASSRPAGNPVDKIIEFSRHEALQKRNAAPASEVKAESAHPKASVSKKRSVPTALPRQKEVRPSPPSDISDTGYFVPPQIVYRVSPMLPAAQFFAMAGKQVRARITVSPEGMVDQIKVLDPLDLGVSHAVVSALKLWQFQPTGKPQTIELELGFELAR